MRQRLLSVLTWVAVTMLATGIGFLAISTVGDVMRGSGPLGVDLDTLQHSQDSSPEATPPRQSTYRHALATFTVQCEGRAATMLDRQPASGATVVSSDQGPDEDVHLELRTIDTGVRLEVYCKRDGPRLIVETHL